MEHPAHVDLVRDVISPEKGIWADFGSGDGAFTFALAELSPKSEIYSVDKDAFRLDTQRRIFKEMFPHARVRYLVADFAQPLRLPSLDGILMANSLHFVEDKINFLKRIINYLKPGGRLVLVEYNVDLGNEWVPYPLSYKSFKNLVITAGYCKPTLITTIPSGFLSQLYSAIAWNQTI